jgi:LIVCS family branched-chain amino acid:cation transporter
MRQSLNLIKTGLATFSMFFGAGNILFPLALGQMAQNQSAFAIVGFLLTAVALPISGLVAMTAFDGDYRRFFARLGAVPGWLIATVIMLLLGPLGSTPRCVALAFATVKVSYPTISAFWFTLGSCGLVYACTVRKRRIVDMLGLLLTPALLISLGLIIALGLYHAPESTSVDLSGTAAFQLGLVEGYYTMDLLAAFFFSSVIVCSVRHDLQGQGASREQIRRRTTQAGLIGAGLLAIVYICFCTIAAYHTGHIEGLSSDRLLGALTVHLLGPYAGAVASVTVALACLTTAIALTAVFADFLSSYVCKGKISYHTALVCSIVVTFGVSNAELSGIMAFLAPVLQIIYPLLIALTVFSLFKTKDMESENKLCDVIE